MSLPFSSSLASLLPTVTAAQLSGRLRAGTACSEQQTCLRAGGKEKCGGSWKVDAVSPPDGFQEDALAVLNVTGNDFDV